MTSTHRGPVARPMRRDAVENQERLLAAAITTMLREGRQVPMSEIAAEAGVGVGTLYRRYPNRQALLLALTERAFDILVDLAEQADHRDGTGLDKLGWYWGRIVEVHDQLVLPLGGGPPVATAEAARSRNRLHVLLRRLIATGKQDGSVRDDLTLNDVVLFGAMLVNPLPGQRDWRRTALRQAAVHLDGIAGVAVSAPRGR